MTTQSSSTITILIVVFLSVLFIAIGIGLIFLHRRNKRKTEESLSWPATIGTVSESTVKQGSSVLMSSDENGESSPVYTAEVSYSYQVGGVEYTSKRVTFGGSKSYSKRESAEKEAALYPVGTQLTVYYNPKNPKEAVLDRTAKGSNMVLGMGIMFIIIGLITMSVGVLVLA
jgi:hypothetical protein